MKYSRKLTSIDKRVKECLKQTNKMPDKIHFLFHITNAPAFESAYFEPISLYSYNEGLFKVQDNFSLLKIVFLSLYVDMLLNFVLAMINI